MHARYYSPGIGRFLSLDLLGGHPRHPQSWNWYAYVLNNPLKYIDPFGLAVECVVKGGSGDDGEEGDEEIVCTEDEPIEVITEGPPPNPFTGVQGLQELIAGSLVNALDLGDSLGPVGPEGINDGPPEFTGCSVFDSAGRCLAKCAADEFGLVLVGSGVTASSLRLVPTRAKLGGAARGTSIASVAMRKLFPQKLGRSLRTPSLKLGTRTGVLGGLLGRAAGPVGAGMLGQVRSTSPAVQAARAL